MSRSLVLKVGPAGAAAASAAVARPAPDAPGEAAAADGDMSPVIPAVRESRLSPRYDCMAAAAEARGVDGGEAQKCPRLVFGDERLLVTGCVSPSGPPDAVAPPPVRIRTRWVGVLLYSLADATYGWGDTYVVAVVVEALPAGKVVLAKIPNVKRGTDARELARPKSA